MGPPIDLVCGRFTTGQFHLHPYYLLRIKPLTGGLLLLSPMLSVLLITILLMHYPHHFPSTFLVLCCIAIEYHTPTSSFLGGDILLIGTAKFSIITGVLRGVHWPLIQRFFAVHCNRIA